MVSGGPEEGGRGQATHVGAATYMDHGAGASQTGEIEAARHRQSYRATVHAPEKGERLRGERLSLSLR
jgi:hypothetical protein